MTSRVRRRAAPASALVSDENLDLLSTMHAELFLANRLRQHGARVLEGVTDSATVRQRIREAILEAGLADAVVGRNAATGKPELYRECFARLYGEPL